VAEGRCWKRVAERGQGMRRLPMKATHTFCSTSLMWRESTWGMAKIDGRRGITPPIWQGEEDEWIHRETFGYAPSPFDSSSISTTDSEWVHFTFLLREGYSKRNGVLWVKRVRVMEREEWSRESPPFEEF
jgi:hypothetical protein